MARLKDAVAKMLAEEDTAWEPGSEWAEEDVQKIERETGLTVPPPLRDFFLNYGIAGSDYHGGFKVIFPSGNVGYTEVQVIGGTDPDRIIRTTLNFPEHRYGPNNEHIERGRVPPGYIFFGTAEGGRSHLLMKGDGSGDEAVYHWGLAYDPWMEGDNRTGIGYVAPSLADFLINLKPMAELD